MMYIKPTDEKVFDQLLKKVDAVKRQSGRSCTTVFDISMLQNLLNAVEIGHSHLRRIDSTPSKMKSMPRKARNSRRRHWEFGYVICCESSTSYTFTAIQIGSSAFLKIKPE